MESAPISCLYKVAELIYRRKPSRRIAAAAAIESAAEMRYAMKLKRSSKALSTKPGCYTGSTNHCNPMFEAVTPGERSFHQGDAAAF